MKFNELNLIEPILTSLEKMKYEEPTPIQEKTIPVMLQGRDVLGCAQTGSGKTAAFALPILQKLSVEKAEHIRSLIMTPTRELAIQICDNFNQYGKNLSLTAGAIYGGVGYEEQVEMLENGIAILAATPGRLLDLVNQNYVSLRNVEIVVLDEADRMLDMGFIKEIRQIMKKIPKDRQTVMFSATMPKAIERLADTIMKDPETIMQDVVTDTVDTVRQYVYQVDACNKLELLTSLIKSGEVKNAIVFTNTRNSAEIVSKHLTKAYVRARAIHSEKNQNSRQDALLQFKNKKVQVLVATDVAARGLDIKELSHVFNYEIPDQPESYIHRIGRTGRAGAEGVAINFCCIDEMDDWKRIEEHIGKEIPVLDSQWSMKVFTKTAKPVKRGVQKKDERIDISKVKDVSLDGKPRKKKSNFQYHKERADRAKRMEEEGSYGRSGNRSGTGKSFKWSDSKKSNVSKGNGSGKSYRTASSNGRKSNAGSNKPTFRKSSGKSQGRFS